MFIAALLISAKPWKQPRCPEVGKWINKLWYMQTIEYYSVIKRNELDSYRKTEKMKRQRAMYQMKEQEKTPEKQLNEVETGDLPKKNSE